MYARSLSWRAWRHAALSCWAWADHAALVGRPPTATIWIFMRSPWEMLRAGAHREQRRCAARRSSAESRPARAGIRRLSRPEKQTCRHEHVLAAMWIGLIAEPEHGVSSDPAHPVHGAEACRLNAKLRSTDHHHEED